MFCQKDSRKAGVDKAEQEGELIRTRDRVKEAGRKLGVPESRGLWDKPPGGDKQGVSRSVL